MRFYNQQHRFYCGVDLHARTMYVCVLDQGGNIVLHKDLPAEPAAFLEAIAPYRDGLVVETFAGPVPEGPEADPRYLFGATRPWG